jgi:hypothetical protein
MLRCRLGGARLVTTEPSSDARGLPPDLDRIESLTEDSPFGEVSSRQLKNAIRELVDEAAAQFARSQAKPIPLPEIGLRRFGLAALFFGDFMEPFPEGWSWSEPSVPSSRERTEQ